jgi:FKBP-type peptidyl-prolyl cis-trans isomerase FkpA
MGNTKIMIISGIGIAAFGVALAGTGLLMRHHRSINHATSGSAKTLAASTNNTNQTQPPTGSSSTGLTAEDGTAQDLSQSTQANPNGQSNASTLLDPSTFSKYDQYKNETTALYADIRVGTGDELTVNKKAAVVYKGWLTNGQLFDASRPDSSGQLQPFVFTLGAHQVITGWEQSLAGMKVGGVRMLIIPPSVGYGASGQGSIPPNSVLVFQVQLLAVQ